MGWRIRRRCAAVVDRSGSGNSNNKSRMGLMRAVPLLPQSRCTSGALELIRSILQRIRVPCPCHRHRQAYQAVFSFQEQLHSRGRLCRYFLFFFVNPSKYVITARSTFQANRGLVIVPRLLKSRVRSKFLEPRFLLLPSSGNSIRYAIETKKVFTSHQILCTGGKLFFGHQVARRHARR